MKTKLRNYFNNWIRENHPLCGKVWNYKERALATNGRVLLLSKEPLPDCEPVSEREKKAFDTIASHLLVEDWPEDLHYFVIKNYEAECPECDHGWKICDECGHESECKNCDGSGRIEQEVEFLGHHVNGVTMSKLSNVYGMMWYYNDEHHQYLGDCAQFRCIVVPDRK